MSLQLKKPSRTKAAPTLAQVGAPRLAQVNLLPPNVRNLSREKFVRNVMLIVVAAAVGLAVLIWATGLGIAASAQDQLDVAQARTKALTAERNSLIPVRTVDEQRVTAELAEKIGMSTEVNWTTYVAAVAAQLPDDMTLVDVTAVLDTPVEVLAPSEDSLVRDRIGSLEIVTRSTEEVPVSEWLTALDAIPGFGNARILTVEREGEGSDVWFETKVAVSVDDAALSHRLDGAETEGEK